MIREWRLSVPDEGLALLKPVSQNPSLSERMRHGDLVFDSVGFSDGPSEPFRNSIESPRQRTRKCGSAGWMWASGVFSADC